MQRVLLVLSMLVAMCITSTSATAAMTAAIYYCEIPNGLGDSCDPDRVPFADATNSWCLFWDRTANGPDDSDSLVPLYPEYAGGNFQCLPFNGEADCGYAGNFATNPDFVILVAPEPPDQPVYFIRVSGPDYCWTSETITLEEGYHEYYLTEDSWTCESVSCAIGAMPDPVTTIEVSLDEACLEVRYSFQHSGENVSGFKVYSRSSESDEWEYRYQLTADVREDTLKVCADGPVQVGIEAVNADQVAEIAMGVGGTYLRRFDESGGGPVEFLGGRDVRLHVTKPPSGDCAAYVWFDFYSGGNFVERILSMTDVDHGLDLSFDCQIPANIPNPSCYIVMIDSAIQVLPSGLCGLTDTTEIFMLGADNEPVFPREFALAQNYPNPFNPSTTIEYTVPNDGQVELAVFNLSGQKVATLFSGATSAGIHRVNWDGSSIATGMYFYRLQMGNQILTRKMLLMK